MQMTTFIFNTEVYKVHFCNDKVTQLYIRCYQSHYKSHGGVSLVEKMFLGLFKIHCYFCEKKYLHFMQLFSADATISLFLPLKRWKNRSQKLLITCPNFFQYCQSAQNQPKSQKFFIEITHRATSL